MNNLILKALIRLPWFKTAQWLLAESNYWRDVGAWLAAENDWYFKLAAAAWGQLQVKDPETLKAELMKAWLAGTISLVVP